MLMSLIVNQLQVDQCYERNIYFSVLLEIMNALDLDFFFFPNRTASRVKAF